MQNPYENQKIKDWSIGTFTYEPRRLPKSLEDAQKEMSKFIRRLKYYAERHNFPPLKYVCSTKFEDDSKKGKKSVHHHIFTNFSDRDVAAKLWRNGKCQTRNLQADDYKEAISWIKQ